MPRNSPLAATALSRRRVLALSALTVASSFELVHTTAPATASVVSGSPQVSRRLTLPEPTGSERLGTVSLHLVDPTRRDPWVPSHPKREIMVQIWYPAEDTEEYLSAPWLSPGAVPHFEQAWGIPAGSVRLPTTGARTGAPVKHGRPRPVVLYSPGYGLDRNASTSLVEELVSHGYIVVAIDHTYDASEVEFPGGRVLTATLPADPDDRLVVEELGVREADVLFTLDQLTTLNAGGNPDAEHRPLPRGLRGAFDLDRIGMFGHSLGGTTAAAVMHDDPRVRAGVNMDGPFVGTAAPAGSDRPFLLLSSDHADPFAGWDTFWADQRGWKLELRLKGSTHGSFTDGEVLVPQLAAVLGLTPGEVVYQIGTGEPQRSIRVQRAYIRAFFDAQLCHRGGGGLLRAPSPRYPEMQFVR
jgi:dienelactone hydrolase